MRQGQVICFKLIAIIATIGCIGKCVSLKIITENFDKLREIEGSIDSSVNPCDDFYRHACGNWPKLQAQQNFSEQITRSREQFEADIVKHIIAKYPSRHQLKKYGQDFADKALTFYHSCKEAADRDDLFGYMKAIKPGQGLEWPLMEEMEAHRRQDNNFVLRAWQAGQFNAFNFLGQMHSYGIPNHVVEAEIKKELNGTVSITMAMPSKSDFSAYNVARVLNHQGISQEVQDKYFAEILDTNDYWEDIYHQFSESEESKTMSYGQLRHVYPQLAILVANIRGQQAQNEDMVTLNNLDYYQFLATKQWQPFEAQKLCNYLITKFLGEKLVKRHLYEETCVGRLFKRMPLAVDYLYFQHIYLAEAQDYNRETASLIRKLLKHLVELVDENHLNMTSEQRNTLNMRLGQVVTNIGNLPENVSHAMVDEFYRNVPDLDIGHYHSNELRLMQHQTLQNLKCYKDMVCDEGLDMSPMNFVDRNLATISLGYLKPPVYHINFEPIFSISGLGFPLGHEYAHSIDYSRLRPLKSFEDISDNEGLVASLKCLWYQTPTEDLDERIADLVGARVAYRTYSKEYGRDLGLATRPWQQLFFLNLAQGFCTKNMEIIVDHDNDDVRLNTIAMNMESFGEAFHCPVGSNMNPAKKCRFY